jgi:hypothetical protein
VCEILRFTTNNQMVIKRQQHGGGADARFKSYETFAIRTRVSPWGP